MSGSLPTKGAIKRREDIKAARRAEGVFPAKAAKKNINEIPSRTESRDRFPNKKARSPAINPICRPETAIT